MGSLIIVLIIGGIAWYIWRCASWNHRVRQQQRDLLALQRRQIELGWKWAQVSSKALDRDLRALEVEELERKWHDSDYRGMA
jgi:hypothetical protein